MGFVDDDVLRGGQERATHTSVLQQQRVVHDHDPRVGGGLTSALQVAPARSALAPTLVAGLVVRGHAGPELTFAAGETQLCAIAALGSRPPHEGLAEEPGFLTRRYRGTEDLPPPGTEIVRPPLEHRHRDGAAERGLDRGQVLPDELILQVDRVR